MNTRSCRFLLSAAEPRDVPRGAWPRVAFVGRSNVGKSSLLNRLVGTDAARTSRTPGRTRLVNCFLVDERLLLLDLPGYGWAKGPEAERVSWKRLAEGCLRDRGGVDLALVLLDARHEPSDLDRAMIAWLESEEISWRPVATKWDKLNLKERAAALRRFTALGAERAGAPFLATSARSAQGIPELWKEIHAADGKRAADRPREQRRA